MYAYIGRQAIYNTAYNVAGYELLYRRNETQGAAGLNIDADEMTKHVLLDAVNVFGIKNLTHGLPAYINFTRKLIMDDFAYLFEPEDIVIEVPSSVWVSDLLLNKLSLLQHAGYRLTLNSYTITNGRLKFDRIASVFDVIRMDISSANRLMIKDMLRQLRYSRTQFLAERVETESQFLMAQDMNFTLFQGYYFERPESVKGQITLDRTLYGRLFSELLKARPSFETCCRIVTASPVLAHLFLRQMTGGNYNRENMEASIHRAMTKVGLKGIRLWTTAQFLANINTTSTDELPRQAFARGRFMERLIQSSKKNLSSEYGFFVGVLSMMARITGEPVQDIVSDLRLPEDVALALGDHSENDYTPFLRYAVSYESGRGTASAQALQLSADEQMLPGIYVRCIQEADSYFSSDVQKIPGSTGGAK